MMNNCVRENCSETNTCMYLEGSEVRGDKRVRRGWGVRGVDLGGGGDERVWNVRGDKVVRGA